MKSNAWTKSNENRRRFIGGSDARIIMGDGRGRPAPPLAGEAGRGRAGRPFGQSDRPARARDRTPESAVVRAHNRAGRQRCPKLGPPPGDPLDGCDAGRNRREQWRGVRSQIHVALVVLGRGGGRKAHGPTPAQHVGHQRHGRGALDYHRRRQVGRDQHISRFALSAPAFDGGKEVLALRGERRAPSPLRRRAAAGPHRGGADRRHELVKCLGRILRRVSANARRLPRA